MAHLPHVPNAAQDQVLIVSLHHLSAKPLETLHTAVTTYIQFVPQLHAVYAHCNYGVVQQELEKAGYAGCIRDIFVISDRARRAGWKRLLILDTLSDRQLKSKSRPGEDVYLTVVAVDISIRQFGQSDPQVGYEAVLAKRMSLYHAIKLGAQPILFENIVTSRTRFDSTLPEEDHQAIFKRGFVLHDSETPLFDSPILYMPEVTKVLHGLPPEITKDIVLHATPTELECPPPAAPASIYQRPNIVEIMAITPIVPSVVNLIETSFNASHASREWGVTVALREWKGIRSATRGDIWLLLQGCLPAPTSQQAFRLLLLDIHIWQSERKIIVLHSTDSSPVVLAYKVTLSGAIEQFMPGRRIPPPPLNLYTISTKVVEIVRPPYSPFYNDMYFEHHIREHVMSANQPLNTDYPVFLMTSKLSDDQIEVYREHSDLNPFFDRLVRWQSDHDPDIEGIFTFFMNLYEDRPYRPKPAPSDALRTIVCMDAESYHDHCGFMIKFFWRNDRTLRPEGRWDRWTCLGCRVKRMHHNFVDVAYAQLRRKETSFSEVGLNEPDVAWFAPPDVHGEDARVYLEQALGPFLDERGL